MKADLGGRSDLRCWQIHAELQEQQCLRHVCNPGCCSMTIPYGGMFARRAPCALLFY